MGKVVANGLQSIEVLRSTRLQNQVSLYTPIHYAWPYPTGCRPLSLLGVSLSDNLNWKPYILNTTNKANLALGFVKRNLHNCPQKVKDQAYKSLVRPRLEYGCTVWDPYRAYQKSWLEQVQRRAARFVTRTYTREEGCVTNALKLLNWPTLEKRRQVARLTLMYKCVTNQAAIDIPCYVHHQSSLKTRASHPLKFIPLQPFCDTYKYSFWPRTIIDWNSLPSDYLTMDSTVKFKATISDYIVFSVMFTPFNLLYFDFYVS